jgi:hypothetical protein
MLTLEDCIAFSELTEEEILAIADHEHIPEMAAAEMGNYLMHSPSGEIRVRAIIVDDIKEAERSGDRTRAIVLKLILKRYLGEHSVAERRQQTRPGF